MAIPAKLMMCAGLAFAGLGLVGAGAGATFTAQAGGSTKVSTGGVGMSLNGSTGTNVDLRIDGTDIGPHFDAISKDLRLKNTGTLDLASTYLAVSATGCDGGDDAPLARALHVRVTDETHGGQVYDGPLCSFAHEGATPDGRRLAYAPRAGDSILYTLVITPEDDVDGLPEAAQNSRTSVKVVFTGSDQ
jgi:hypothetical protein